MQIVSSPQEMQALAMGWKRSGRSVGFVPTMGCLHEGHLSLMRLARPRCDVLVASIFVNPAQFGPNEDLEAYPRDFERDEVLCHNEGVDVLYYPQVTDMYAADASVGVDEKQLTKGLCGALRPGHFRGVCTVVAKLFNLVLPDLAVFGEKDAQQLRVIRRMVRDLNFPVEIVAGPIIREADGLAMSSRNRYLNEVERAQAICLRRALDRVQAAFRSGEFCAAVLMDQVKAEIGRETLAELEYVAIVDNESLEPVEAIAADALVALAVRLGSTRLIDNDVLHWSS